MGRPGPKRAKKQDETAYLLRSPANAKRLLKSIESLERGKGIKRKIKL